MADSERLRSAPGGSNHGQIGKQLCACGREAIAEKCGRSVCRGCADNLHGREFPVRGAERCSFGSNTEKQQLDMVDFGRGGGKRFYGRYIG